MDTLRGIPMIFGTNAHRAGPDLDLVRPEAKNFDETPFMGTGLSFRRPTGREEKKQSWIICFILTLPRIRIPIFRKY